MDYEKAAAEFIARKMPRKHPHPSYDKYQMFTKGERFALFYLMHRGGECVVTPSDIAKATHTSSARVAMILKSLEAKGYIERNTDPDDRRKVIVSVTKAGRDIITREQRELVKIIAAVFKRMGERDANEFIRLSDIFFQYMSGEVPSCAGTPDER
jgi:DNA-binding MarR family transcriptional regulator